MNLQIDSYSKSLVRIYGAEEEIRKQQESIGSGSANTKNRNKSADTKLVRKYAREMIQEWFNTRMNGEIEVVKLEIPGWRHPPLDFCDTRGLIVGRIRYTSYEFELLDNLSKRGVAIPEWTLDNLRLACGLTKYPNGEFFKCGFVVYVDQFGDVFALTVPRFDHIIRATVISGRTERAHINYGSIGVGSEIHPGISYDFTAAWFVPTRYWVHFGRISADKMAGISTSWEAKQRQKQQSACRELIVRYPDGLQSTG